MLQVLWERSVLHEGRHETEVVVFVVKAEKSLEIRKIETPPRLPFALKTLENGNRSVAASIERETYSDRTVIVPHFS